jgi:hypothetical protein
VAKACQIPRMASLCKMGYPMPPEQAGEETVDRGEERGVETEGRMQRTGQARHPGS